MKPMVSMASKRGAREMSAADQLDAAADWGGASLVIAPRSEGSAAMSRDETG